MNHRCALQILAGVVLLAATLSTPSLAQPSMSRVTITHVRPDMLTEWVDLQKNEVDPALKKAGEKTRTVYVSGRQCCKFRSGTRVQREGVVPRNLKTATSKDSMMNRF